MKRKVLLIICVFMLVLLLVGCSNGKKIENNKDKTLQNIEVSALEVLSPLEVEDSAKASKQVKENIVKIINKIDDKNTIYGTGFFDKSGYLVTNSHVVDLEGEITVQYSDGSVSNAIIYSNDTLSDLALLSVEDVKVKALPIVSTMNLEVTNELYSIGYQLNLEGEASVTKGILSAKRVASGIEFLQTDAAVNSGGSGGPVINAKGEVLGIISLANENATLSFAISSDTLLLYIDKLIKNSDVKYVTEKRETNALSSVLKEVNYKEEDIYDEEKYLKKNNGNNPDKNKDGNEDDDNGIGNNKEHTNNGNGNNSNNSNNEAKKEPVVVEPVKDYSLEYNGKAKYIHYKNTLSTDINHYFIIGKDLTNYKLDVSQVNMEKNGEYPISVTCDQKSMSETIIVIAPIPPNEVKIPEIVMDETQHNVTSLSQIEGVWYYPGYQDVCQKFYFNVDMYSWDVMTMDQYAGRLSYNTGGGSQFFEFDEMFVGVKMWVQGNYLVITTDRSQYTLTREKGVGVYNENHIDNNMCLN